jgi:phosphoribosyl 1,2-cyclic phosphodiesterase
MITVLASSSAGNAYLLDGRSPLLLDCGLSIRELKRATGYRLSSLAGCLCTHEHGDHSKAAADLMRAGVDCYMSQGTADALGLSGHRLRVVKPLQQVQIGAWTVLPFDTVHDAAEPLGFLIAGDGEKVLYLTDTAYCPYCFRGLTRIMIECNYSKEILDRNIEAGRLHPGMRRRLLRSHMSLDRVLDFLAANDLTAVREIILVHLSDGNSDAGEFKRQVQAATGRMVRVAEKGGEKRR